VYIELVELLRCIREHEESWLVAAIDELSERSIKKGRLGCPICGAEYPIVDGIADFSGAASSGAQQDRPTIDVGETALRAGAFLGLAEAGAVAVLGGSWAAASAVLAERVGARVVAANAPEGAAESPSVAPVKISNAIPLGLGSCDGVALDATFGAESFLSAQRIVRPGGRIVGPKTVPAPDGLAIIAEDESWWIGQKAPELTPLHRGNR
jgi:uncharacterized protein YbaR (Trm112 family)